MTVEISYRMKATLEGETLEEIKEKWESLSLSDYEQGTEFVEMEGAYDQETNEEVFLPY